MIIFKMRVIKMKYILVISALLLSYLSFGKGHGGGGHSSGRSISSSQGSSGTAAKVQKAAAPRKTFRTTAGMPVAARNYRVITPSGRVIVPVHPGYNGYTYEGGGYGYGYGAPGYYYGNYGYSPILFDPFFSMFSFGAGMVYTPHYNYANTENTNENTNNAEGQYMDGYVVYAMDTIAGDVKLTSNAVFIESKDSVRSYDYKFHLKQKELAFVSLYNSDGTQVCLTRIKTDPKKLWRIVHEGKLNLYDQNFGFIYKPEDIDYRSVMVLYNGEPQFIGSSSKAQTKQRLTEYINKIYGADLNPNDFTWKQLLIYLDKLD